MDAKKAEIVREAMKIIRSVNSEAQQEASRRNGRLGGRPSGSVKPLSEIPCNCDGGNTMEHKSTCPRGRAIRRRKASAQ